MSGALSLRYRTGGMRPIQTDYTQSAVFSTICQAPDETRENYLSRSGLRGRLRARPVQTRRIEMTSCEAFSQVGCN